MGNSAEENLMRDFLNGGGNQSSDLNLGSVFDRALQENLSHLYNEADFRIIEDKIAEIIENSKEKKDLDKFVKKVKIFNRDLHDYINYPKNINLAKLSEIFIEYKKLIADFRKLVFSVINKESPLGLQKFDESSKFNDYLHEKYYEIIEKYKNEKNLFKDNFIFDIRNYLSDSCEDDFY